MFKLSDKQQEYYEAIKWLLDDENRASGRTTLMAKVYIELAIRDRNKWIDLVDHYPSKEGRRSLFYAVKNLAYKYNKLLFPFEFNERLFKFRIRNPEVFLEGEQK